MYQFTFLVEDFSEFTHKLEKETFVGWDLAVTNAIGSIKVSEK